MIFVTYDFYLVISLLQSTLYKTETFGDGTKCLSYRETNEASKERRCMTNSRCLFYRGVRLTGCSSRESRLRVVFTVMQSKFKMETFQYRKSMNIQKTLPSIRSVQYFICEIFGKTFYPNLYSFVWSCHACLCPFQGYKCNRWKPTETSVFKFSY